jgi:ERCC4-related helicase
LLLHESDQAILKKLTERPITFAELSKLKESFVKNQNFYQNTIGSGLTRAWALLKILLGFCNRKRKLAKNGFVAFVSSYKKWYDTEVKTNQVLRELVIKTDLKIITDKIYEKNSPLIQNEHPKVGKLVCLLQKFFEFPDTKILKSKVLVFIDEKINIKDICEKLKEIPQINAHEFVGQGGDAKSGDLTMSISNQQKTLQDFRDGKYNTLIATCVAEEGLDINEVDMVVNYDVASNPTRFMQRRGRTGRKREGRCVNLLLAEDKLNLRKTKKNKDDLCDKLKVLSDRTRQGETTIHILGKDWAGNSWTGVEFETNDSNLFGEYQMQKFEPKLEWVGGELTATQQHSKDWLKKYDLDEYFKPVTKVELSEDQIGTMQRNLSKY